MVPIPNREAHQDFERRLLGRTYPRIHEAKDKPGLVLGKILPQYAGSKHRLIGHRNPLFNLVVPVILYPKDPLRAIAAAVIHDALDYSRGPSRGGKRGKRGP